MVATEACASAHYWGRETEKLGHEVKLVPPIYVKPFVKRQKNDTADAEATSEAAQRPTMSLVAVKTEEQQARGMLFRTRDLLVRQRTQTFISADGTERMLPGGMRAGCMHVLDPKKELGSDLEKLGGAIVIAADDGRAMGHAVGLAKAAEAAKAVGGKFVAPRFTEAEKAKGMTDYNDLARSRGKETVREELAPLLGKDLEKQAPGQEQERASPSQRVGGPRRSLSRSRDSGMEL